MNHSSSYAIWMSMKNSCALVSVGRSIEHWKGKKIQINWLFVMYCHFPPTTNPAIDVTPFDIGFINESNGFNNVVNILRYNSLVIHRFYQYYGFLGILLGSHKKKMQIKIEQWHSNSTTHTHWIGKTLRMGPNIINKGEKLCWHKERTSWHGRLLLYAIHIWITLIKTL